MTRYASWFDARPDLRVSDAEREQVARALRDHAAEGRLTPEELDERVERAYRAVHGRDLHVLLVDLPRGRGVPGRLPRRRGDRALPLVALGALAVIMPGALWFAVLVTMLVGVLAAAITLAALGLAFGPLIAVVAMAVVAARRHRARHPRRDPFGFG